MSTRRSALLVGAAAVLLAASTAGVVELTRLRTQLHAVLQGQRALQDDVQEIARLLGGRAPASDTLARPVALDIEGLPFLGSSEARVVLVEFTDFQCPFCARHTQQSLPAIVREYVEAGRVKYVLRDFPIRALHPEAPRSHEAAHCAADQGRFWDMHERLFEDTGGQGLDQLIAHARALQLNVPAFEQCLATGRHAARVQKGIEDGARAGVRGTPTIFVGVASEDGTVQATKIIRGAHPYERFRSVIEGVLAGAPALP